VLSFPFLFEPINVFKIKAVAIFSF
jgi:hypothetical protein